MTTAFTGRQRAPQLSSPPAANEARRGDWIQTFSGHAFWPMDPRAEDIYLEDIAHALSNQCRFSGHTSEFYSVAEHSVRVMALCGPDPADQGWGLMHDAAEAYLIDLPRPIKHLPEFADYRFVESDVMDVVAERFRLGAPPGLVKVADNRMLVTEVRDLMTPSPRIWGKWIEGYAPVPERIRPMSAKTAERAFLAHAARLGIA